MTKSDYHNMNIKLIPIGKVAPADIEVGSSRSRPGSMWLVYNSQGFSTNWSMQAGEAVRKMQARPRFDHVLVARLPEQLPESE